MRYFVIGSALAHLAVLALPVPDAPPASGAALHVRLLPAADTPAAGTVTPAPQTGRAWRVAAAAPADNATAATTPILSSLDRPVVRQRTAPAPAPDPTHAASASPEAPASSASRPPPEAARVAPLAPVPDRSRRRAALERAAAAEPVPDAAEPASAARGATRAAQAPVAPSATGRVAAAAPAATASTPARASARAPVDAAASGRASQARRAMLAARRRSAQAEREQDRVRARLADTLRTAMHGRFTYPAAARRRGLEGTVLVALAVREDGALDAVRLAETSGHEVLDRSALRDVRRVGALPAVAAWLGGRSVQLRVPVEYRLTAE